jgi:hypothetical protein
VQEKVVDLQKITEMKRKIFVPSKKNRKKSLTSQKKMNVKEKFKKLGDLLNVENLRLMLWIRAVITYIVQQVVIT